MTDVLVRAPQVKRPTRKVSMNDFMIAHAGEMNDAILLFDAMPMSVQRATVAAIYAEMSGHRERFGLKSGKVKLTTYFDPAKGKEDASNVKIGKNLLPTLSLTISSSGACQIEDDGTLVTLNTCSWAGLCGPLCVLSHGRGRFVRVIAARNWRTFLLWNDPVGFAIVLRWEMMQASRRGHFLARLNVNSDLPWYLVPALFDADVSAYDYTKNPSVLVSDGWILPNYRLIYSLNERSDVSLVEAFLSRGGSIAAVTNRGKGEPVRVSIAIGSSLFPVEDGDESDDRFNTPAGTIVDLYAKGKARGRRSKFIQNLY